MLKPETEIQKIYYSIGEVAKLIGITTSHIRFYQQELGLRINRGSGDKRKFTRRDIDRLLLIHRLHTDYFHLPGIKRLLAGNNLEAFAWMAPVHTAKEANVTRNI